MMVSNIQKVLPGRKYYSLTVAQGQEGADSDFSKKEDINDTETLDQVAWRRYESLKLNRGEPSGLP